MAKGKPKKPVKTSNMPTGLKKFWRGYNARLKKGGKKAATRAKTTAKRSVKRVVKKPKRPSRKGIMGGLGTAGNYLLGSAGSWIGEEIEQNEIRPRAMDASGSIMGAGAIDLVAGFGLNYVANRMPGGRAFVKGMAYTIGGKGVGMVKHSLTGTPGVFPRK